MDGKWIGKWMGKGWEEGLIEIPRIMLAEGFSIDFVAKSARGFPKSKLRSLRDKTNNLMSLVPCFFEPRQNI